MAYGEGLKKLSPCTDELIIENINRFCPGPSSVLDLGCGRGERLAALEKCFPKTALAGVDIDGDMLAAARENTGAELHLAAAEKLPFEGGRFCLALCECSLSLFSEPEKALVELYRVLKAGGVLLLGDIYGRLPLESANAGAGGIIGAVYGRGSIESMAAEAGFELMHYEDRSGDLTAMAAQMIFDGSLCGCMDTETLLTLRRVKAGYGLWMLKKEEN